MARRLRPKAKVPRRLFLLRLDTKVLEWCHAKAEAMYRGNTTMFIEHLIKEEMGK